MTSDPFLLLFGLIVIVVLLSLFWMALRESPFPPRTRVLIFILAALLIVWLFANQFGLL